MKLKRLYELDKVTVYKKFNWLYAFTMLQFYSLILLGFIIIAAVANNVAVFGIGGIIYIIGFGFTVVKYFLQNLKIKQYIEELDVPPEPPKTIAPVEIEETNTEPKVRRRILI